MLFATCIELTSSFSAAKKLNVELSKQNWKLNAKVMDIAKGISKGTNPSLGSLFDSSGVREKAKLKDE